MRLIVDQVIVGSSPIHRATVEGQSVGTFSHGACSETDLGVVAQLVERLNGIQEVRGSTPRYSTPSVASGGDNHPGCFGYRYLVRDAAPMGHWLMRW